MCSDPCFGKIKRENLIKLSTLFTWINVLHIFVRIVKIYLLYLNNTEKVILIKLSVVYNDKPY